MSTELLPRVVLVVGPSGAGKTEFCRSFTKVFPQYVSTDDLAVILEYLRIDRLIDQSPPTLREKLQAMRLLDIQHTVDVIDAYLRELAALSPPGRLAPRYCTPLVGGEMKISDPQVWDEAVVRLARSLRPHERYVVQIARGHDPSYLQHFALSEGDVYPRTLQLFLGALDPHLTGKVGLGVAYHRRRGSVSAQRAAFLGSFQAQESLQRVLSVLSERPHRVFPESPDFCVTWVMDWALVRCALADRLGQRVCIYIGQRSLGRYVLSDNASTAGALRLLSLAATLTIDATERLEVAAKTHGIFLSGGERVLWQEVPRQDLVPAVLRMFQAGYATCGGT